MAELYREKQKFNQWWVWIIMLLSMFIGIGAGLISYMQSGDIVALLIGAGVAGLTAILFAMMTLKTVITTEGIEVGLRPFTGRRIFRSEIEKAYVRKYDPIGEYGGWGYRMSHKGKAYNTSGNFGLQLEMKDGEKLLIGTQHPEVLEEIMSSYIGDEETEEMLELKALEAQKLRR